MQRARVLGALVLLFLVRAADAALVPMTFSGGSGTPLTVTLTQPITYTVTASPGFADCLFLFHNVGNPMFGSSKQMSGTMAYSINGGPPISINVGTTGVLAGARGVNDLSLEQLNPGLPLALGDVVVLSGSATTTFLVTPPAPANGLYSTIFTDGAFVPIGTGEVPEPTSTCVLGLASILTLRRNRRRT